MRKRFRLLALAAVLGVAAGSLLAAGCGGDDDDDAGAGATTAAAPAALPIEERVVTGELGGLPAAGPVGVARTPAEFSTLVDDDEAAEEQDALAAAGFAEGAVQRFGGGQNVFGLSAVAQFESPEQAQGEAERFRQDIVSDLPPDATTGALPGVPGSTSVTGSATDGGTALAFANAIFADGPFVYVQIAGGAANAVDPQATLDAATALYEKVKGSPAP